MTLTKAPLSSQSKFRALLIVLVLCLIVIFAAFFIPNWRDQLRAKLWGLDRKILASLVADMDHSGSPVTIFKVIEKGTLFIEFYSTKVPEELTETLQDRSYQLIQKIELPGTVDGYVSFMGEATNLAVANLDNDPYLELVVPSFNYEFVASLDIVKYNPGNQKYELMTSFDIPEGLLGSFSKESH